MKTQQRERSPEDLILVYRETIEKLYAFVSRRAGGSRELAEDVTQEAYLRAMTAWARQGLPDCPLAWLQTVARNLLLNHYRRRQPDRFDGGDVDAALDRKTSNGAETGALVCWGLARISTRHARVLEAYYLDDRPVRDIAEDIGVSERAVEGRLRRARVALRKLLLPHVGTEGDMT